MRYINKTRFYFEKVIESLNGEFYGPGHTPKKTIELGVASFVKDNGPYDIILCDEYITQDFSDENSPKFKVHACNFPVTELKRAIEWRDFLTDYKGLKIIVLVQSDYWNFSNKQIEVLKKTGSFFICYGEEFVISKKDVIKPKFVVRGLNKTIYEGWNDNFYKFIKNQKKKIISYPEVVSKKDAGNTPFRKKRRKWLCIGANYDARVVARQYIGRNIFRPDIWFRILFKVSEKINFNIYNKFWTLELLNYLWGKSIETSKFCYTCGAIVQYPITKFFEIPVKNSLLISPNIKGLDPLGFKNGNNIIVSEPDQLAKVEKWLVNNPKKTEKIAMNGQKLILNKHIYESRIKYIKSTFKRILKSKFKGSFWQKGGYYFR